jgi:rhomboid family GlyGly-CTERM serine protease
VPFVTLTLAGLTLVVSVLPGPAGFLGYEREAVAAGEAWRPLTGQLVHWTPRMALADLAVLLVFGCWLERRSRGILAGAVTLALVSIGAGLHLWLTALDSYRGSSGLATACFAATAIFLACDPGREPRWRWIGLLALALLGAKIAWESWTGEALAAGTLPPGVRVVPRVHLLGAAAGLLAAGTGAWLRRRTGGPARSSV